MYSQKLHPKRVHAGVDKGPDQNLKLKSHRIRKHGI